MASSTVPMLYMFPASFYSQKVRLALSEKKIKHKETLINISEGDQNTPSYLKLNPDGEVPMLRIGDQYFTDSEKLIEIIDQLPSDSDIKLVPAENTPEGEAVAAWRTKLNAVDCANLTYGILLSPELSIDGPQLPPALRPTKEGIKTRFANTIEKLEKIQNKYPDLQEACQRKIQLSQQRSISFCDKANTMRLMDELDKLMDDVEKQLQTMKSGEKLCQYLCGPNFTAADITLCVVLGRMILLGILSRYIDPKKRPGLCAYWNTAKERPDVHRIVLCNLKEVKMIKLKKKVKQITLATAGFGLISVGIWMAYKHFSESSSK